MQKSIHIILNPVNTRERAFFKMCSRLCLTMQEFDYNSFLAKVFSCFYVLFTSPLLLLFFFMCLEIKLYAWVPDDSCRRALTRVEECHFERPLFLTCLSTENCDDFNKWVLPAPNAFCLQLFILFLCFFSPKTNRLLFSHQRGFPNKTKT